ncbi:uncharacterized protein LOC756768 [Strongylocentrotus purpuratus]|uniref:Uncharacterized protein n=1 Tax=Strongylocentrotus purpuratus TaxID=7668 RepID=A0A7M7G059_STRPU|nr:uncharacterized protein LOC756768 [Strongylocentrotus purpuratus]|eukprot:XP_001196501.2 PREDICTED: uncharacterized protein LOC756768 [Strongylocentrotus purpuratus]
MELRIVSVPWKIWWNLFSAVILVLQFKRSFGELRLGGGSTAREGRLEVAYENNIQPGKWASVCGDGWTNEDAIVACNEAGFPGPAVAIRHAKEKYGESYLNVMLTNVNCNPEAPSLLECRNTSADARPCRTGREAGAICQMPGYEGCYKMVEVSLKSDAFMISKNMTLDTCMGFCMNRTIRFSGVSVDHCHCWNYMPNTTTELMAVAHHHCIQHCPANPLQVCGGTKGVLKTFAVYDTFVGFCNDPGDIMNGFRDSDWFQFGSLVTFQCDEGYVLEGSHNLTCIESGPGYDWNDASPICARLIVTTPPPTMLTGEGGILTDLNGEQKLEVLYVGIVGGSVGLLLLIVIIAFAIACCKSRKKKVKTLINEDDEEAQMSRLSKKKRKKSKKTKKVKKKHKERDIDEKDKDELELEIDSEDDGDNADEPDKDDYDEEESNVNENKANAKLDVGPIATADLSYYQTEQDQTSKNKNKPLPSARGQGRPTSSSKPAKFNFIETDQRKNSKRSRGGMMKNVLFVKGKGDNASDVLLTDPY